MIRLLTLSTFVTASLAAALVPIDPENPQGPNIIGFKCTGPKQLGANGDGWMAVENGSLKSDPELGLCYDPENSQEWLIKREGKNTPEARACDLTEAFVTGACALISKEYNKTKPEGQRFPLGCDVKLAIIRKRAYEEYSKRECATDVIYLASKYVSKNCTGLERAVRVSELYKDFFPKDSFGYKNKMHFVKQWRMTEAMRAKKYVNMIASGWLRAFFADYSFHPLNYILVELDDGTEVVVGIDYGSSRWKDRFTGNVTWGPFFDPLTLHRSAMKVNLLRTESNYFKFLPKEDLFGEESMNMLRVLSEYDPKELQQLFQELSNKYEQVYGQDVIFEFGKRFGSIRREKDLDGKPFQLPEEERSDIDEGLLQATIENHYFWTLGERQKCCKLMLAEVMLYRHVSSGCSDVYPNPFQEFKEDTFVIDHLTSILLTSKAPLLLPAMTGTETLSWGEIKQGAMVLFARETPVPATPVPRLDDVPAETTTELLKTAVSSFAKHNAAPPACKIPPLMKNILLETVSMMGSPLAEDSAQTAVSAG